MLNVTLKSGEAIRIDHPLGPCIMKVRLDGVRVRIAVDAPREIGVSSVDRDGQTRGKKDPPASSS